MIVAVLLVFIIIYVYYKYPDFFDFRQKFVTGRYVRLERESGSDPINFANFIIRDKLGSVINPVELNINPSLLFGDGRTPRAYSSTELDDIVLIETAGSVDSYIEYDIGSAKNISNVTIINRRLTTNNAAQRVNERLKDTVLRILDNNRNGMFEKRIINVQNVYSIDVP